MLYWLGICSGTAFFLKFVFSGGEHSFEKLQESAFCKMMAVILLEKLLKPK
jgi:hypothetical protein